MSHKQYNTHKNIIKATKNYKNLEQQQQHLRQKNQINEKQYILKQQLQIQEHITFHNIQKNIQQIIYLIIDQKLKQRNTIILAKITKQLWEKNNNVDININKSDKNKKNMQEDQESMQQQKIEELNNQKDKDKIYIKGNKSQKKLKKDNVNTIQYNNNLIKNNNLTNNSPHLNENLPSLTLQSSSLSDPLLSFSIEQINQHFCSQISAKIIKKLVSYFKHIKYSAKIISNGIIIQNSKSGFNIGGMCFWNNSTDGQKTYKKQIPAVYQTNKTGLLNQNGNNNLINDYSSLTKNGLLVVTVYICKFQKRFTNNFNNN